MALVLGILLATSSWAQNPPMIKGDGWAVDTVFTVSQTFDGYQPPGILDGLAIFDGAGSNRVVLVNHELNPGNGYAYSLLNGLTITGARISAIEVSRNGRRTEVVSAQNAYDAIYDRAGVIVTAANQINEVGSATDGLARLCSAQGVEAGTFGFVDDIFFTGEETSTPFHPHGGTEWALDVQGRALWAIPACGRGAWENVTPLETGDVNTVALLLGDDKESAPLYLYVGQKNSVGDSSFLDRNGLAVGQLYVWVATTGDLSPQDWNGSMSRGVRAGSFLPIAVRDIAMAGMPGYDAAGYKNDDTLRSEADAMGAFSFSRPEDLHTNPIDGTQAIFASTGRGGLFPADNWGTLYLVDVDFSGMSGISASLEIVYDADALVDPDQGIRNPDNLTWADNGVIYVQEDRSTSPSSLFGASSGEDASIWAFDIDSGDTKRIAQVNRSVVLPAGATDIGAGTLGHWETSGVIDVTGSFDTLPGETLLLATVQAHGIRDGLIGDNPLLDEGGQLVFMSTGGTMMRGDTANSDAGWRMEKIFTVSETFGGYQAPGILDGVGAFYGSQGETLITVNHELNPGNGYSYALANGTTLTGARISIFEVTRDDNGGAVQSARLAYDSIYDRQGQIVTSAAQINETGNGIDGLARLCSAQSVLAGTYGFVDDIFFTGEETSVPFHPHGGSEWALDVQGRALWALPALGRGAWENVTAVETGLVNRVALLMGDDTASAPLYLYVGQKNAIGDNSFLDRNGLAQGQLYVWRADNGDLSPEDFNGFGSTRSGVFVPISVQNPAMAGMTGHDAFGYKNSNTMQAEADALGAFSFSRPEDLHTNPSAGAQAVFASTGRGALFPSDNWGIIYIVDLSFGLSGVAATLRIVHDADDLPVPDAGIRSPDNLTWADDGFIYVQEDRSTSPSSLFGAATGAEASIWQLCPESGDSQRVAEMDRSVVLPAGTTDIGAGSIGNWESSGVLDVTSFFPTRPGERLLIATVQAHGIRDGLIGDNPLLDEGGQLIFLSKTATFPGSDEDFEMDVLVNGELDLCSAPDVHEVRANDLVTFKVNSADGTFDAEPVIIVGQIESSLGFLPEPNFGEAWIRPGATPSPFFIVDSVATPFGPSNLLQSQGNSYLFAIGPVTPGISVMTQAFVADSSAANGFFASSQGQVINLVN